jgi:calpain-7
LQADFADNKEFITVLVYAGARRVYYPFEPRPISEGVRINSPHYLCKLVLPVTGNSDERTDYTLVVAQYEQLRTIYYSLRVYSTVEFTLKSIAAEYAHVLKVRAHRAHTDRCEQETGEWKGHTAGGCANYRDTYASNPMYEINMSDSNSDANQLCIELRGPKQFSVGFELKQARTGPRRVTFDAKPSGSYRLASGQWRQMHTRMPNTGQVTVC